MFRLPKNFLLLSVFFILNTDLLAQVVPQGNQERIIKSNLEQYSENLPSSISELIKAGEYELLVSNQKLEIKGKVLKAASFPDLPNSEAEKVESPQVSPILKDETVAVYEYLNADRNNFESLDQVPLHMYKQAYTTQPFYHQVFRLRNLQAGSVALESAGVHLRYFQRAFNPNDQTVQLYRERIQINAPELLRDYNFLRFIFATKDEVAAWIYSPLVKKCVH
jgi:hypothetical protein